MQPKLTSPKWIIFWILKDQIIEVSNSYHWTKQLEISSLHLINFIPTWKTDLVGKSRQTVQLRMSFKRASNFTSRSLFLSSLNFAFFNGGSMFSFSDVSSTCMEPSASSSDILPFLIQNPTPLKTPLKSTDRFVLVWSLDEMM